MADAPQLLAVPNVSEGRDARAVAGLARAFARGVHLLDSHTDATHNRSVFTLAGHDGPIATSLEAGAHAAVESIDMRSHEGAHPCVGALDVAPVVYLAPSARDRAERSALEAGERIGALGVPVFLYGYLATSGERRERAHFRGGGLDTLARRMDAGELRPDFGPSHPHPSAGATLVTARPPLAAFNLELEGIGLEQGRRIAADLREAGGGLEGVRAIALDLGSGVIQISTNVHDPISVPLRAVVASTADLARPLGGSLARAEVVGLLPRGALEGFPAELSLHTGAGEWDPAQGLIEERIAALAEGG